MTEQYPEAAVETINVTVAALARHTKHLEKERDDALLKLGEATTHASDAKRMLLEHGYDPQSAAIHMLDLIIGQPRRKDECPKCKARCCVEALGPNKFRCDFCRTEFGS
jgi:hypothetical protein